MCTEKQDGFYRPDFVLEIPTISTVCQFVAPPALLEKITIQSKVPSKLFVHVIVFRVMILYRFADAD
jgi:hypothetical protein